MRRRIIVMICDEEDYKNILDAIRPYLAYESLVYYEGWMTKVEERVKEAEK